MDFLFYPIFVLRIFYFLKGDYMKKIGVVLMWFMFLFVIWGCISETPKPNDELVFHSVVFDDGNEDILIEVQHNRRIGAQWPAEPTAENYRFEGWYEGSTYFDSNAPITRDVYLEAKWRASITGFDDYYEQVSFEMTAEQLRQTLNLIIKGHYTFAYSTLNEHLSYTDQSVENPDYIYLTYSGTNFESHNWNKEHVWPQSRGGFGTRQGIGTDMHHLRPTITSLNSERGNYYFDEGGVLTTAYPDYRNYVDKTIPTFEPRDEDKGDIARMLFYMDVRYEGDDGFIDLELVEFPPTSSPWGNQMGNIRTLLKWHLEDPVSDQEIQRNNRIFELQGNRNPFIDIPEFAFIVYEEYTQLTMFPQSNHTYILSQMIYNL